MSNLLYMVSQCMREVYISQYSWNIYIYLYIDMNKTLSAIIVRYLNELNDNNELAS